MDGSTFRAGIEIYGRVMRYAEIEVGRRGPNGGAPPLRLVRLGACDFDFDVAEALLALVGPTHLDTVTTAVREIFDGSRAEVLRAVVHPWNCTSFFSPLPDGMPPSERFEQLRQEAAMLSDASVARPVRVKATPVRIETLPDGRRTHWHHVLRLSDNVHARFEHIAQQAVAAHDERRAHEEGRAHEFVDATGAAAAVAGRLLRADEAPPYALALGVYGDRTEYALCRGTTWHFGYHAEAGALEDGAYFGAALLDRLGVDRADIGHLFLYGEDVDPDVLSGLEYLLGLKTEALNPLAVFRIPQKGNDPFVLAAYAPVIGSLLR